MRVLIQVRSLLGMCVIVAVAAGTFSSPATASDKVASSDRLDPIANWIDANAARFGLLDEKRAATPPANMLKSLAYRPSEWPSPSSGQKPGQQMKPNRMLKPTAFRSDQRDEGVGGYREIPMQSSFAEPSNPNSVERMTLDKTLDVSSAAKLPEMPVMLVETAERKVYTPPVDALKSEDAAVQISAVMKDLNYSDKCSGFANESGFGKWGQFIIDQLLRGQGEELIEGTEDLSKSCPAYDYLGVREKAYVWVKIFAAMSFRESSCNPRAAGEGPHGVALGLLQLHAGNEPTAAKGCVRNASRSVEATLSCGLAILSRQIQRDKLLFSPATHFGVLRPQGDVVKTKQGTRRVVLARLVKGGLQELPLCQRK